MRRAGPFVRHGLTTGQTALLDRHRRGLLRLASELATRNGLNSHDIMFTIADRNGRTGRALSAALPGLAIGPVVLPGRAVELDAWVKRLALHGPVWDFTRGSIGIPAIVIDADDAMAVVRLGEGSA
jgi:hypothetical protein